MPRKNYTAVRLPATKQECATATVRPNWIRLGSKYPRNPNTGPEVRTFTRWLLMTLLIEERRPRADLHWSGLAYYWEKYPHRRSRVPYDAEVFFRQIRPAVERELLVVSFMPDPPEPQVLIQSGLTCHWSGDGCLPGTCELPA